MELNVVNIQGKETGKKVVLNELIFGVEPNDHAIYLDVKQYLANQRQGTHKSKEKAEVTASTRKIKKQKGTGGARAGSLKSGLFRGGGRFFGPRPRNYGFKLNKKVKQLARKSALTYKAIDNNIIVLEDFTMDVAKTKEFLAIQNNLKLSDKKSLFILSDDNKNIYLSSRNLQGVKVVIASDVTTYDILNASSVVILEGSLEKFEGVFNN